MKGKEKLQTEEHNQQYTREEEKLTEMEDKELNVIVWDL
jgi:hypothetical protein